MARRGHARATQTYVGLEQRFVASVRALNLQSGLKVIVGFSGGKDSLALALLCARTERITGLTAELVYVNHNLRETSSMEADAAKALAGRIGLSFTQIAIPAELGQRHPGAGIEEAARRERYLALSDLAQKSRTDHIVTAHQQQDQAETVLLHLLRGAGLSGMSAMSTLTEIKVPWWNPAREGKPVCVWRPLLAEAPDLLAEYVADSGLVPVIDPSNDDARYLRNAIRHQVLPVLTSVQPQAVTTIARFADIASQEDHFLTWISESAATTLTKSEFRIDRMKAQTVHPVLLRRVLKRKLATAGVSEVCLERLEQVEDLVHEEATDRVIQLSGDCIAVADDDWLFYGPASDVWQEVAAMNGVLLAPHESNDFHSLELDLDQSVEIAGYSISTSSAGVRTVARGCWKIPLPPAAFEGRTVLRTVAPGDQWATSGIGVRVWLRLRSVHAVARSRVLVLATERGVWCIPRLPFPKQDRANADQPVVYLVVQQLSPGEQCEGR
ncbi:MAG: tRNA lysidine(34) synthetase TilS [Thermomicrobiales bacterium]